MKLNSQPRYSLAHFLILTSLIFILTACTSANSRDRRVASAEEPTPVPTAVIPNRPTYTVERGDIQYIADFNGRISPANEIPIAFDRGGIVAEVFVERNDTVLQGDALARLDIAALEGDLSLALAALDVAQSRLEAVQKANENERDRAVLHLALAQIDLDYAMQNVEGWTAAQQEYEVARLTVLRDLAQLAVNELDDTIDPQLFGDVQQAELRIDEIEAALAESTLVAPASGQVVAFNVRPGQAANVGVSVGTIANLDVLEVSASLQPRQMEELAEGLPVELSLAGSPGATYPGTIRQMPYPYGSRGSANSAPTDASTRFSFDNIADADNFELGSRVNITVLIDERSDALFLPPAAIREFNGRNFVVIQDGAVQSRVDVELGIEGDGRVEIINGLTEGQSVVGQ